MDCEALRICGFPPSPEYLEVVATLQRISIVPPGRERPTARDAAHLFGATQTMRHFSDQPEDFNRLRAASSRDEFERIAVTLNFPLATEPALPAHIVAAVEHVIRLGPGVVSAWRFEQRAILRDCARALEPLSRAMRQRRPPHVAWAGGDAVNIALVCACVDAFDWPDKQFPYDQFMNGVQLIGQAKPTGLWCPKNFMRLKRERGRMVGLKEFHKQNAMRSGHLKRLVEKRAAAAAGVPAKEGLIAAAFELSMNEVRAGTARGPYPYTYLEKTYGYGRFRPLIRSVVVREDGKRRAVDNGRTMAQSALDTEILGMMHPTFPAAVARLFHERMQDMRPGQAWSMGASKDDETAAYKATPAATPQFTPALVADPVTRKAVVFMPRGVNFGHRLAGRQYSRKPTWLVDLLLRIFGVVAGPYVDDITILEADFVAGPESLSPSPPPGRSRPRSGQAILWDICELLHIAELAPDKSSPWSQVSDPIGIQYNFTDTASTGDIFARIKPSTAARVASKAGAILSAGQLSAESASSFIGKFRWVACLGQIGVALSQPLYRAAGRHALTLAEHPDIVSVLGIIIDLVKEPFPAAVFRSPRSLKRPLVVFSDAFWQPQPPTAFGIGGVAFIVIEVQQDGSERCWYAAQDVPFEVLRELAELKARKNPICVLETR